MERVISATRAVIRGETGQGAGGGGGRRSLSSLLRRHHENISALDCKSDGGVAGGQRACAHQFKFTAACAAHIGSTLALSGAVKTPGRSHCILFGSTHAPLQTLSVFSGKTLKKHETQHTQHTTSGQRLTSRRTAVGYGRGARVRTLVPSRILPRASPVHPDSCSQEDLTGEVMKREGRELPACWEGTTDVRRWMNNRKMVGWVSVFVRACMCVCAPLALSFPFCLCLPLLVLLSPLEL